MKHLNVLALLALLPVAVMAANNFDDEVNAELDKMYETSGRTTGSGMGKGPAAVQVNVNTASNSQAKNDSAQNTESVAVAQVQPQKQPTTFIEASPLTESRADKIRKARQDVEVQTEQKIVEKLEMSRIDDEKRRAEVLFGDKFTQLNGVSTPQPAPVVAPVVVATPTPVPVPQVVQVAPVAVQEVAPPTPSLSKEDVRAEVTAALQDMKEKQPEDKWQMGVMVGTSEYNAKNVKGNYAFGFSAGKRFHDRIVVEGAFNYSNYQVEQPYGGGYVMGQYYPRITEMDQYQGALTTKIQFLSGVFRPLIGATMAYTYRSFTDTQFSTYNSDATSQAVDVGAVFGADLDITESFSIGADLRYMTNMTSKTSSDFQRSFIYQNTNQTPIEKVNYMTLGIVARTSF